MPSDHGGRLDQNESVPPAAPRAPESKPQDALFPLPTWPTHGLLQQGDLLTKGDVLEHELRARAAQGPKAVEQECQHEVQRLHGRRC